MNYGLLEELAEYTAYVLGASKMPFIPYVENGDWRPYAPPFEHQAPHYETSACTAFAVETMVQFFMRGVYGEHVDFSENFLALVTPIDPKRGVDPQKTFEAARHYGMLDGKYLSMPDTLTEWVDSSRLTGSMRAKALNWLEKHDFQHEWLWSSATSRPTNYIDVLRQALTTSPIGISVSAWEKAIDQWGNEVYVSRGDVNNHKTVLVHIDPEGYPWVSDSYQPYFKRLSKDHNIRRAKRIWINKRTKPAMRRHIGILQAIINRLMQKQTLLSVATAALGSDATPQDATPDEVACAEVVTTLLRKVYPETPLITGTWTLNNFLANSPQWKEVNEYEPECVVVAPTGTGRQGTVGHTWIVMEDGTLASNNSYGLYKGKFTKNYTPATAERKYRDDYKMQMHIYKHI